MGRFEGKVAIVTGAGSGIGEATAKLLASEGAAVVLAALHVQGIARVAEEITAAGGLSIPLKCDVGEEESICAAVRLAVDTYGRLDLLHNNAAATDPQHLAGDKCITEMDIDVWDKTMTVNLRGAMLGCKHAIPQMIRCGGGAIVNTSSVASLFGAHQDTAYGVSKAALEALTRYVAVQYGKQGVRCNAVLPSITMTQTVQANIPPVLMDLLRDYGNALPRLASPQDIAEVVCFLLSNAACHVTGQSLGVDGGYALQSAAAAVAGFAIANGQTLL